MYTFTLNRVRGRLSAGYRTQGITHTTGVGCRWSIVVEEGIRTDYEAPRHVPWESYKMCMHSPNTLHASTIARNRPGITRYHIARPANT